MEKFGIAMILAAHVTACWLGIDDINLAYQQLPEAVKILAFR